MSFLPCYQVEKHSKVSPIENMLHKHNIYSNKIYYDHVNFKAD